MPTTVGNISLHLGPTEQGGPDSVLQPILDFINATRRGQLLRIAVQEIDHEPIARAIVEARKRGARVQVVLEQDYLRSNRIPADPFAPGGTHEANRFLLNAILRSTIDIRSDFNIDIFHQKFMIRGNSVLTGSTNFTSTGVTRNLNHVVVINDAEVSNAYSKEFREIRRGRFGRLSIDREERPRNARVSGIRVKPLFAPDHGPEMEIMKQILKARSRIDFAVFTFSQSSGIDEALIAAAARQVQVTGVLDSRQANQGWAATRPLAQNGVRISVAGNLGSLGKLHHKMMVIDDNVTILGSFNYTGPANITNDENILIIGDLDEPNAAVQRDQEVIALAARGEIQRIISSFGTPVSAR